ncbi:MAG TPA: hypothetical protein VGQ36_17395 [Thermoanaerobaculia bacterium]|jgi:hypothetical protein|nr:hypothetical protein [Thermoanaerobaculia bacterium]
MRKLLVVVALLFVPLLASAQQGNTLLQPDGTLYSVQFERAEDHPEVVTESSAYLKLTARRGEDVKHEIIPATTQERGANYSPTIAYDSQSGMLFVFWIHGVGMMSSQLMFTSRSADGVWAPATTFGGWNDQRKNLRIAVTRKFRDEEDDIRNGLSVHLAWWELNITTGEGRAKYAMASVHDSRIYDFEYVDLAQFLAADAEKVTDVNKEFLNQPVLFTTALQDSVVLMFGDIATGTMNQVRITPRKVVGDGRLRVPGGRREGGFRAPAMEVANMRVDGVYSDSTRIALYAVGNAKLQYVLLSDGKLSEPFTIKLDSEISSDAAVDALRRLVNEH